MKRIVLLVATLAMVAVGANAQKFQKGDMFLGARATGLDFNYAFADGVSATNFGLAADFGGFFSDKFAAEVALGVELVEDFTTFAIGAGVRYYPVGNFFGMVSFAGAKSDISDFATSLGVSIGYDWFLSENVFFEPAINYTRTLGDYGLNNLGLSLGIGVKF